jgi:hypothetical protein
MGFGFLTFWAAIAAAIYARKAAVATEETVEVSRDIGRRQVRAYVNFTNGTMKRFRENENAIFTFTVTSAGSSPGYNVRL